ncbi:hypothetical protein [Pseudomonas phoenicis]|uniref:hypothetical protein n=1 Tax=unclassified Pseudomonas TaxID=196821 RepID=UPI0039A0AF2D
MNQSDDFDNDDDLPSAQDALIEVIENQIASGEPPATKATLNKLTLVGVPREDSLILMAMVLTFEIENMLADDRPFDTAWYEQALRALPELPPELVAAIDQGDDE